MRTCVPFPRWRLPLALAVLLALLGQVTPSSAAGVEVTIDDGGYSPSTLTVIAGTTVTWVNRGKSAHTVTHDGNTWDSGGLAPGRSFSYLVTTPGTYTYHSENDVSVATDAAGNVTQVVPIKGTLIVILPPATPATQPTAAPQSAATPLPLEAVVAVNEAGFQPSTVTVPAGGAVIWVNKGQKVHTSSSDNPMWDTGGIAPGETRRVVFNAPGQFTYHSTTDSNPPGSIYYTLIGVVLVVPAPPAPTPILPGEVMQSSGQVYTNGVVSVTDGGYQPQTIRVAAGGSVTWVNDGTAVHTATHDITAFDSGGLPPGKSFMQPFPTPGVYYYHSETDANPPNSHNYVMRGRIIVVPAG